jgi:hypothetical protein
LPLAAADFCFTDDGGVQYQSREILYFTCSCGENYPGSSVSHGTGLVESSQQRYLYTPSPPCVSCYDDWSRFVFIRGIVPERI